MLSYKLKHIIINLCLKIIVILSKESNSILHCKNEVPDWFKEELDSPNRWMAEGTVELLAVLCHQGHSGGSIGFALNFFKTMAMRDPWGPLTDEESEWAEPFDGEGTQQNKRCGAVFRRADGTAYTIDGKVFHDGDNVYYTNIKSRVDIEFPYNIKEPEVINTKEQPLNE